MLQSLVLHILAGIAGLWIAVRFVPNVEFTGSPYILLVAGGILGVLNTFVKPILNLVTLPLRLLTLGLFGLVVNMLLVWAMEIIVNVYYPEVLDISTLLALFWTTLIIWAANMLVSIFKR